jgi:DNA-binding NtrC family response regulator
LQEGVLEIRQVRIYLIDDEPIVLSTISGFLSDLGHCVTCATSVKGLDKIAEQPATDLVITDLRVPGSTGLKLIRRIRELLPDTPIVVISGHRAALQNLRDVIEKEAYAFLYKPFSLSELEELLARLSSDQGDDRSDGVLEDEGSRRQ